MKKIPLTHGQFAHVDNADFEWLSQWKWHLGGSGYAVRTVYIPKKKTVLMHCLLRTRADHRDGNKLNNIRKNLRSATKTQNARNAAKRKNASSKYKGVSLYKPGNKWRVRIRINKNIKYIGYFPINKEKDAALAYNKAAKKYFGRFARLNVI